MRNGFPDNEYSRTKKQAHAFKQKMWTVETYISLISNVWIDV